MTVQRNTIEATTTKIERSVDYAIELALNQLQGILSLKGEQTTALFLRRCIFMWLSAASPISLLWLDGDCGIFVCAHWWRPLESLNEGRGSRLNAVPLAKASHPQFAPSLRTSFLYKLHWIMLPMTLNNRISRISNSSSSRILYHYYYFEMSMTPHLDVYGLTPGDVWAELINL